MMIASSSQPADDQPSDTDLVAGALGMPSSSAALTRLPALQLGEVDLEPEDRPWFPARQAASHEGYPRSDKGYGME